MHLLVVGLNHHTASVEIRERVAFAETALPAALERLRAEESVLECAILSTCNRTEVYAVTDDEAEADLITGFLSRFQSVALAEFESHLYTHHADEGVRHLMRVASGLDSLVLGEPQILKQVRDAFEAAAKLGAAGPVINGLFRAAIMTGKRARTETDIGRGGFSVGHAAVDLARSIFSSLHDARVMILGAGKMSELTARHLMNSGIRFVMVANRTYEKATALAERLGGEAIRYDDFPEALSRTDIVISSTAAPHYVVQRDIVAPAMRKRRGRPLFLIDIAVPRDISPDVASLDNVFLYDLDDLEAVVADMARDRASEVQSVEDIVVTEAARFMAWLRSLDAAPLVTQLRTKHEVIRQAELARLRNQLPDLPEHAWPKIDAALRSMMNRITRDPITSIKAAATDPETAAPESLLDAARRIFALDDGREREISVQEVEAVSKNGAGCGVEAAAAVEKPKEAVS